MMQRLAGPAVDATTTQVVTTDSLKVYLGETEDSDDTRIGFVVSGVNMALYRKLGRFVKNTGTPFDYLLDGVYNQLRLWLPERPIVSIQLLESGFMGGNGWQAEASYDATSYTIDAAAGSVTLNRTGAVFPGAASWNSIRCTWLAGYATVPDDLLHAAHLWALNAYNEIAARRVDVSSVAFEGGATQYLFSNIPDDAVQIFEAYRRKRL